MFTAALFALQIHWQSSYALLFTLLALLPLSELSIQLVNAILTQILPPFILPKMLYKSGLPENVKTAVVFPVMLSSQNEIEENIRRLEVAYLANLDPSLRFGLFYDFTDALQAHLPEDQPLLEIAIKGLKGLNEKYGADRFFLLHRERVWSKSENRWIGWERKRGKLECFNRFLIDDSYAELSLDAGSRQALKNVRFVITLDAEHAAAQGYGQAADRNLKPPSQCSTLLSSRKSGTWLHDHSAASEHPILPKPGSLSSHSFFPMFLPLIPTRKQCQRSIRT